MFRPDYFASSLLTVPMGFLQDKGIKGLIIDLDNTLTNWNNEEINPQTVEWLLNLQRNDFKICIVSNNNKSRIESTLRNLAIPFIANALKPTKKSFFKAMEILGTNTNNTAIIGDQIFTDILGGKRVGIFTILVPPLSRKEFMGTRIMRVLERVILKKLEND